eukprot:31101-Rhodomonas_salina.1
MWSVRQEETDWSKLTVGYVDWAHAYGAVDHEALFHILAGYGFTTEDLSLLRGTVCRQVDHVSVAGKTAAQVLPPESPQS